MKKQREELSKLREKASCISQTPDDAFQQRLNINTFQLYEDLQSLLVFDYTLHQQIGCLLDTLFHPYNDSPFRDRVRSVIAEPERLDFTFNIFLSGFVRKEHLFVIKTNSMNALECLYEYIIGKLIVNPLREITPNFMYTYAYHECGTYAVVRDRIQGWCTTDAPQEGYLYLEKITGETLLEFCLIHEEGSVPFVEVMLQVINALYLAYQQCSFRHNDLHGRNIIIRELSTPICIPIVVLGQEQYLHSRYVAQIIDFGTATAMYNGEMLKSPTYYNMFAERNSFFPYDIYMRDIWGDIWEMHERYPRMHLWIDDLRYETSEEDQTFAYIASSFIETMGCNPLHDIPIQPTLPLRIIGNTERFYRRYYMERQYSLKDYYDIMDTISDEQVADMVNTVVRQVYSLTRSSLKNQEDETESSLSGDIFLQLDRLYEIIEHVYLLKSYQRLAHKHDISEEDEELLNKGIIAVSKMYERKVQQVRKSIKDLQQRYYDGYAFTEYLDITSRAMSRLFLLPRARDI